MLFLALITCSIHAAAPTTCAKQVLVEYAPAGVDAFIAFADAVEEEFTGILVDGEEVRSSLYDNGVWLRGAVVVAGYHTMEGQETVGCMLFAAKEVSRSEESGRGCWLVVAAWRRADGQLAVRQRLRA